MPVHAAVKRLLVLCALQVRALARQQRLLVCALLTANTHNLHTQYTALRNDARWHAGNGSWSVPGLPPGLLSIAVLDTNPFITRYLRQGWAANAGAAFGCAALR